MCLRLRILVAPGHMSENLVKQAYSNNYHDDRSTFSHSGQSRSFTQRAVQTASTYPAIPETRESHSLPLIRHCSSSSLAVVFTPSLAPPLYLCLVATCKMFNLHVHRDDFLHSHDRPFETSGLSNHKQLLQPTLKLCLLIFGPHCKTSLFQEYPLNSTQDVANRTHHCSSRPILPLDPHHRLACQYIRRTWMQCEWSGSNWSWINMCKSRISIQTCIFVCPHLC